MYICFMLMVSYFLEEKILRITSALKFPFNDENQAFLIRTPELKIKSSFVWLFPSSICDLEVE